MRRVPAANDCAGCGAGPVLRPGALLAEVGNGGLAGGEVVQHAWDEVGVLGGPVTVEG